MNCPNCGKSAGRHGNKHVRSRRFTCTRADRFRDDLPNLSPGSLPDWVPGDELSDRFAPSRNRS